MDIDPGFGGERDAKDYAIEFGGYLANAAERLLAVHEETVRAEVLLGKDAVDYEVLSQARDAVANAVYEFRKRAVKATVSKD